MKRMLKVVVLGVVVLVLLVVGVVFLSIDGIAKSAIERGATYALGVKTTVDKADVGVLGGRFSMAGLDVANPEGFEQDHFLQLGVGAVAVSLGSLREDTVRLPSLTLDNIDMNLERKDGSSNYGVILDHLKSLESGERPPEPSDEGPRKKFVIEEVVITDVKVDLIGFGGALNRVEVPIDEIRLTVPEGHS